MEDFTVGNAQIDVRADPQLSNAHFSEIFNADNVVSYALAVDQAKSLVMEFLESNKKPFSGITPVELGKNFESIDLERPLESFSSVFREVKELYVDHATAFHLPGYIAHLNCPVVIPALAAEVLISAINSSQDTWDQSAGGTLMEIKLINWTAKQLGFRRNPDGVFTAGGSQSNLMGLLLARDHFALKHLNCNIKLEGNPAAIKKFRLFVAETAHFSNQKNASLLGIGEQGVVKVKTDNRFRMDPLALEKAIMYELEEGNIPFCIVATAGTTDFGNIDPLGPIGKMAEKFGLWLHVDAAYGCGLLLTDDHRKLLDGIELADSVTVDYHKSFFQPISGSAFIVSEKNDLQIIRHHADYLNPEEQDYDEYPAQINKSIIQSTRRFDALKVWFTLRLMGRNRLGEYIDKLIVLARAAGEAIHQDSSFELLCYSDISILVFRYIPDNPKVSLCAVNTYIKKALFQQGEILLASTKVKGEFFLKFTIFNPAVTLQDIQTILKIIKQYGAAYKQS